MRRSSVLGVADDEDERSARHVSYVLDDDMLLEVMLSNYLRELPAAGAVQ